MNKKEFVRQAKIIKNQLYKTAYLYLGNEANALDVVDETIYKGYKALWQLREEEYFTTWMTRILINECKKELKRLSRIKCQESLVTKQSQDYDYDQLPLKEAIRSLPTQLKDVVILRYFSGYTLAEAAKALNIPQGTVVTRQRKALKLLKLELGEEE
ncbi:sigma-70 family RNA polymerase sigma factor [Cellulosilyticum lentocellum]|uniref:RNA polymerase, sigma-24 subunit, ECF subfamily n=1 Tax=Cellulosilyticum lentocellum (strain ATCC 49066 / DSM 5427 / NCIMB 11756 / RHM5) TaxID=642492 RepID=F2JKM3_CELLD|nr:sigma-70 family RNA polymerase sigma factor [Cellulosilyticum lentocellum]ADZ82183.1 RNA polymerase, sigma-24 subunit, ECF subfamily [Cellulosilyticum lentocellum DSM 5427]